MSSIPQYTPCDATIVSFPSTTATEKAIILPPKPIPSASFLTNVIEALSSRSIQAVLVDLCLTLTSLAVYRLMTMKTWTSAVELAIVCHELAFDIELDSIVDAVDQICATVTDLSPPPLVSLRDQAIVLALFACKSILAYRYVISSPRWKRFRSRYSGLPSNVNTAFDIEDEDSSRPFELVIISVTVHSLGAFAILAGPSLIGILWNPASFDGLTWIGVVLLVLMISTILILSARAIAVFGKNINREHEVLEYEDALKIRGEGANGQIIGQQSEKSSS